MGRRTLGWLAVAGQFAAILGIIVSTGTSAGGPRWLWVVGLVCVVIGVAVLAVAFVNLGRSLTPTPVPNGAGLQQSGLYAYVRHPIYTGVLLVTLGVVLRSPGFWPAAWWLVLAAVLYAKARWEERMLSERFAEYPAYMGRTGRFLPRM